MTLNDLNMYALLRQRLDQELETLAYLRAAAGPSTPGLTGMPHGSGVSDKVGNLAAEIADMSSGIDALKAAVDENEQRIVQFIETIEDRQIRVIFRLRFVRGLTWREVAEVVGGRNSADSVRMICYRYFNPNA